MAYYQKGKSLKKNSDKHTDLKIYDIYEEESLKYPLILSIPHSGRIFPPSFAQMTNLEKNELRSSEDLYVDELLSPLFDKGYAAIVMNITRSFIDVNRDIIEIDDHMFKDYPADKITFENNRCRSGYGLIHRITSTGKPIYNSLLSYKEVQERIKSIYVTYHKALKQLCANCLQKFGYGVLLDCHSMPSKICSIMGDDTKIDICLGDLFLQSCPRELTELFKDLLTKKGYAVAKNVPYSGAYTTFHYCEPREKMYTLQLELNRALYTDEHTLEKNTAYLKLQNDLCDCVSQFAKYLADYKFE